MDVQRHLFLRRCFAYICCLLLCFITATTVYAQKVSVQMDYGVADMKDDKTITFKITNPQDVMTVYGYWGNMKLKSVTLVY